MPLEVLAGFLKCKVYGSMVMWYFLTVNDVDESVGWFGLIG
jgi:hypothetical protein